MKPLLYERATSSCSFRIRIALNLSGVDYEHVCVSTNDGKRREYRTKNPQGLVPLLVNGPDNVSQVSFHPLSTSAHRSAGHVPKTGKLVSEKIKGNVSVIEVQKFACCLYKMVQGWCRTFRKAAF